MYDLVMLIAQITDLHISTPDSVNDRHFRTAEHLERAVAHLNGLSPRPDLVLATGDLVERGEPEEYARLRAILDGLAMPLYVIPGNHDARGPLARAFADAGYLPGDGGFLHYTIEGWPVRLIGLDTHVPGAPGGLLCAERLAWLDARLGEGRERPTVRRSSGFCAGTCTGR
jgi:Icc protein